MTTPRTIPLDDLSEDQLAVLAEFQSGIILNEDPPEDVKLATAEVDVTPYARKGKKGVELVEGHVRVQEVSKSFFRDPVERLKGLEGTWDRWTKEKIWTKSAAEIKDDESLNLPKGFEEKSSYSKTFGAVSARWQGDHIDINPKQWDESEPDTRAFLLAHEMSHAAAADILANFDEDQRKAILEPFAKGDSSIQAYDVGHLHTEGRNEWARPPEEMLSDIGAELLIYGSDVLDQRFESNKQYDIGAEPEDDRLQALYAMVAEALKRVGNPPTPGKTELEFVENDEEVTLAVVEVDPYVRRGRGGIEFVVGHERQHRFDIDQALARHFTVPQLPIDAARRQADMHMAKAKWELDRLERLTDAELNERTPDGFSYLHEGVMANALRGERRYRDDDNLEYFRHDAPEDANLLLLGRGDSHARSVLVRKLKKKWEIAQTNAVSDHMRTTIQTEATELFSEDKMSEAAARFGLPVMFAGRPKPGLMTIAPRADFNSPAMITVYDHVSMMHPGWDPVPVAPDPTRTSSMKNVLRHEYGHMVGGALAERNEFAPLRFKQVYDRFKLARNYAADPPQGYSTYGMTSVSEGWAEAFAIVMHPGYDREAWRGVDGEELLDVTADILRERGVPIP